MAALSLLLVAAPAEARRMHLRHHADPVRAFRNAKASPVAHAAAIGALPATWCGTATTSDIGSPLSNAPQIKVIYAYAADQTSRFTSYQDKIQADVNTIRQKVDAQSGGTKSVRFDLGSNCSVQPEKYIDVQVVHLPQALAVYNGASSVFTTLKTDLLGVLSPPAPGARVDYIVYADKINKAGAAGEADTPIDDSHGYGNGVNRGPNGDGRLFAMIYGRDTGAPAEFNGPGGTAGQRQASFLHELSHTQGAVQGSAPHTTGAGHCYDEQDIMCYNDGGPSFVVSTPCASGTAFDISEALDCNKDDYFNATPAGGSYLATHWNEFDSIYLCQSASCDSVIGPPTASLSAPASAFRGNQVTLTANVSGASVEHYEWDLNNDGLYDVDTGSTNSLTRQMTSNGTLTVRVRASTSDGVFGTDSKSIAVSEPTTPVPTFSISSGTPVAGKAVTFDASATTDPSAVITNYKWDYDGDGVTDFDGGTTKTATTTYATAGARLVTLEVDYPLGLSKISAQLTVGTEAHNDPAIIAPTLSGKTVGLAKLRKTGLPLTFTCGAACTLTAKLSVSAATARKLHLKGKKGKPVTIGSVTRTAAAAGAFKVTIALTAAARRALKHARSVTTTLSAKLTQAGFQPLVLSRRLTIRR